MRLSELPLASIFLLLACVVFVGTLLAYGIWSFAPWVSLIAIGFFARCVEAN